MIREDLDDMARLREVVPILGEGVNDGVELLVVYIPTFLCCLEFVME